jgi:hypothetical protein
VEIKLLEHVNIQTTQLELMENWYIEILELEKGYRPPFGTNGAWLYGAGYSMVHLIEVDEPPERSENPELEYFAMRAVGLESLLERLKAKGILYFNMRVPDLRILQVNFYVPEGNHIHIDFTPGEADALGF